MKKRGFIVIILLIFLFVAISFLSQTTLASHLEGEEQRNQVIEWNRQLITYANLLETRQLTAQELSNAIEISRQRKEEMISILNTNDEIFYELVLMQRIREAFPEQVRNNLEQPITLEGEIFVIVIDSEEGSEIIHQLNVGDRIIDLIVDPSIEHLAKSSDRVRVSGFQFEGNEEVFIESIEILPQGEGGGADFEPNAFGQQNIAIILFNFADLEFNIEEFYENREKLDDLLEDVNLFYRQESFDLMNINFEVFTYTLDRNYADYFDEGEECIESVDLIFNQRELYLSRSFDFIPEEFNTIYGIYPISFCGATVGIAYVGPHQGNRMMGLSQPLIDKELEATLISHELGHTRGLFHEREERNEVRNVMYPSLGSRNKISITYFTDYAKTILGWLGDAGDRDIDLNPEEILCEDIRVSSKNGLDITFVGDRIESGIVRGIAESFSNSLETKEPFAAFNQNINVRYIETIGGVLGLECGNSEFQTCNSAKVYDYASTCTTDEIIVIPGASRRNRLNLEKAKLYWPYGQYAVTDSGFITTPSRSSFKELAKSMGYLADETEYFTIMQSNELESLRKKLSFFNFPNCDKQPQCNEEGEDCQCNKWSAISLSECHQGCGFDDWYRDESSDLMRSDNEDIYGIVDQYALEKAITRHLDYTRDPVSYELTENAEDFIVQKFLEANNEPIVAEVPGIDYALPLDVDREVIRPEWYEFMVNLLCFDFDTEYECRNERLEDKRPPRVEITIENMQVDHESNDINIQTEENTLYLTLTIRAVITGEASVAGDGEYGCLIRKKCSDGIIDVPWSVTIYPIEIYTKLNYRKGNLGELRIEPTVLKVTRPVSVGIRPRDVDLPSGMPEDLKSRILELLFEGEGDSSIRFTTVNCGDGQECIARYIHSTLDEIGYLFRFSLDMFITGNYEEPRLGRPLALIYDFYLDDQAPLAGIEVLDDKVRMSGMSSLGAPVASKKAACVREYDYNLEPVNLDNFNRIINVNPEKHGAIKISKTFTDWHNWHLWHEGEYCAEKRIPVSHENSARYLNPEIFPNHAISEISYRLVPKNPPQISYEPIEGELADTLQDRVYAEGDYQLEISILFREIQTGRLDTADIMRDDSVVVPLNLEEPDLTLAIEEGYSPAQSYFRSDIEDMEIINDNTECSANFEISQIFCNALNEGQISMDAFEQDIKHVFASHYSRGLAQSPALPVRDIAIGFGQTGLFFFEPGINLNLGEYIAKTEATTIDENTNEHLIYDFELIQKCIEGEYCGDPDPAKITAVQEIFYKENIDCSTIPNSEQFANGCRCIKEPTEESQACINALIVTGEPIDIYIKVDYGSRDHVSNNFNLINWNSRKPIQGTTYSVYLTESINTYNKLANNEIEVIEEEDDIYRLSFDSTQVVAFRAETEKGVPQKTLGRCTASVIIDVSNENGMFNYIIQPVLIKIEERLRDGSNRAATNDIYEVCAYEDHQEEYAALIFPEDISFSS